MHSIAGVMWTFAGPTGTKVIGSVVNLPMAVIGNYRGVIHDGQDEDKP